MIISQRTACVFILCHGKGGKLQNTEQHIKSTLSRNRWNRPTVTQCYRCSDRSYLNCCKHVSCFPHHDIRSLWATNNIPVTKSKLQSAFGKVTFIYPLKWSLFTNISENITQKTQKQFLAPYQLSLSLDFKIRATWNSVQFQSAIILKYKLRVTWYWYLILIQLYPRKHEN